MNHDDPWLLGVLSWRGAVALFIGVGAATGAIFTLRGYALYFALLYGIIFGLLSLNAWIDARTKKLVPFWTHAALVAGIVMAGTVLLFGAWRTVLYAAIIGLTLWVLMGLISRSSSGAFGKGDARLIAVLGFISGLAAPSAMVTAMIVAAVIQLLAFAVVRIREGATRVLPYGPALVIGAWAACLMG